ncbi:ankyrin repeat-containing domain protein [Aspergillus crustosus]
MIYLRHSFPRVPHFLLLMIKAIHHCCWQRVYSTVIVSMLLDAGADVSVTDSEGRIPLHLATLQGSQSVFKAILSRHDKIGTNSLVRSRTGRTVFDMAVEGGHLSLVELLIERNIDVTGDESYSPLHAAVANKHPDIAEILLSRGADPLRLDIYGRTAFDWAASEGTLLNRLVQCCSIPYTRTERSIQLATLQDSVARFANRILSGEMADSYKLAKCLVYLGDGDAARAIFLRTAMCGAHTDDLRYPMGCNVCRKRLTEDSWPDFIVLVCRRCHDLDLCDWMDTPPFLGFSSDAGFPVNRTGRTDANTAGWTHQLEGLIAKYS